MAARRLIVGLSGASGIVYGVRLLELLRPTDVETHLIISKSAERTHAEENGGEPRLRDLADVLYAAGDVGAAIASGSYRTMGMIVIPCSVKTLAGIATGLADNLIARAADVTLKERRRLVLVVRETPLNLIHLRNMATVTEAGGIIAPPVPAFYANPRSIDDLVTQTASRMLDLFDIDTGELRRWRET
ncbi:MAG: UbiX family flavin prenyltransferase [Isosphaeraceae bacterium]